MATFTFDSTHRSLIISSAGLNGSTLNNYLPGDDIQITDSSLTASNINLSSSGNTVYYNGGSFTISNLGPGRIVARNISSGGVDLKLQQDAHNDFTGDGVSDVLWRNADGTVTDWLGTANGSFSGNWNNLHNNPGSSWHVAGTGDFNGDGHNDVLWLNDDGTITDWLGTASGTFTGNWANLHTAMPSGFTLAGIGDFNGDGIDDLLLRKSTGGLTEWLGQANGSFTANARFANPDPGSSWHVAGTGDFNGDGVSDILWRNDDGTVTDWLGNGDGTFSGNWNNVHNNPGSNWHVVGTGDFNGDAVSDILWRADDGTVTDWLGSASGTFSGNWNNLHTAVPTSLAVVGIGDYTGDAIDDLLLRNSSGGLTEWSGQANGGFATNSHFNNADPGTTWHVQDAFVHDPFG